MHSWDRPLEPRLAEQGGSAATWANTLWSSLRHGERLPENVGAPSENRFRRVGEKRLSWGLEEEEEGRPEESHKSEAGSCEAGQEKTNPPGARSSRLRAWGGSSGQQRRSSGESLRGPEAAGAQRSLGEPQLPPARSSPEPELEPESGQNP